MLYVALQRVVLLAARQQYNAALSTPGTPSHEVRPL
jgi:hypothetical protein